MDGDHTNDIRRGRRLAPLRIWGIAIVLFVAAQSRDVQAGNQSNLTWHRGADAQSCIDETTLRDSVEAELGRKVFSATAPRKIQGWVDATANSQWNVEIKTFMDGTLLGTRHLVLTAERCGELNQAIVLMVALVADSARDTIPDIAPSQTPEQHQRPAPLSVPSPPADNASAEEFMKRRATPLVPASTWNHRVVIGGGASVGRLPTGGLSALLGYEVQPPGSIIGGVSVEYWPYAKANSGTGRVLLSEIAVAARLCHVWGGKIRSCGMGEIGWLQASGEGFSSNFEEQRMSVAIGSELGMAISLTNKVSLLPLFSLSIPLARPSFLYKNGELGDTNELYQASPVAAGGKISVFYSF